MQCIEGLIRRLWKETLGVNTLPDPFPRITYDEAMARYGSDKPYIQLEMEVHSLPLFIHISIHHEHKSDRSRSRESTTSSRKI